MQYKLSGAILSFLLVLCLQGSAQLTQQWSRTFNARGKCSDRIQKIKVTNSGDIIVAGSSSGHRGFPDAYAMRYSAIGDTMWTYRYDGSAISDDYAYAMAVDANENVYLTGKSRAASTGWDEMITIKLNAAGVQQWVVRYSPTGGGDSQGNAIEVDNTGNVYVAGWFDPPSSGKDWLVIKYNANGVPQFTNIVNSTLNGDDEAFDLALAPNGNLSVCGYLYNNVAGGYINAAVKQYTSTGILVWEDTYTNPNFVGADQAMKLKYNSAGELIVAGETNNASNFNRDPFLISYNSTGVRNWSLIVPDSAGADVMVQDMKLDQNDNILISSYDYGSFITSKVSSAGVFSWRKRWRGPVNNSYDTPFELGIDANGSVYTIGRGIYPGIAYYGNQGADDFVISKLSSNGDSLWTYRANRPATSSMGFAIFVKGDKVYGGGFTCDTAATDENLFTVILDTAGVVQNRWIYNGLGDAITQGQFVRTDAQNNVYCAATVDRLYQGGMDVAVVKYNSAGTLLWESYYSTPGFKNDTLTGMVLDINGNPILSISSDTSAVASGYKMSLVKMDSNGNFIDTTWYFAPVSGNAFANDMKVRTDNSVVVSGKSGNGRGLLVKWDNQFNFEWALTIDSTQFVPSAINQIALFANDDIAIAGFIQPGSGTTSTMVVHRYDGNGQLIWASTIDSVNVSDDAKGIAIDNAGNVAVTGASGSTTAIVKLEGSTGSQLWRTIYNPTVPSEYGVKTAFTPIGDVAIICRGYTGFVSQYHIAQFNGTTGSLQWAKVYNQAASDREPKQLLVDPSGRVVTAGYEIVTGSTNFNYVINGYSSTGTQLFVNTYTSPSNNPDILNCLTSDSQGNYLVTGQSALDFMNNYLYRMVTIKYGSAVTGIEDEMSFDATNVHVYPNPSTGTFTINDGLLSAPINKVTVRDLSGRTIITTSASQNIDLTDAVNGIYLLTLERVDGTRATIKISKQ
ncbi:MAG TPA: T9SS type A sorting domain-containing protein [Bacteroidia bacterium]|nr:T9SS type A sorting domain-containing protein [Bacteroidia bacterium]